MNKPNKASRRSHIAANPEELARAAYIRATRRKARRLLADSANDALVAEANRVLPDARRVVK